MNKTNTTKKCVQCMVEQPVENFRPYYGRGKDAKAVREQLKEDRAHNPLRRSDKFITTNSKRDSLGNTVSRYTICYDCEAINGVCTQITRTPEDKLTEVAKARREKLIQYYKIIPGKIPAVGLRLLSVDNDDATDAFGMLVDKVIGNIQPTIDPKLLETASEESQKIIVALKERTYTDSDAALDIINANKDLLESEGLLNEALGLHADWEEATW